MPRPGLSLQSQTMLANPGRVKKPVGLLLTGMSLQTGNDIAFFFP